MSESKEAVVKWLTASGEKQRVGVEARLTRDGAMAVLPEPVAIGQTVWIEWDGEQRRACVRSRESSDGHFIADLHFLVEERRQRDRIPVSGRGEIHWYDRAGRQRVATVEVEDVTESGVRLKVPESLRGVPMLRLTGETWECLGRIRYCEPTVIGYTVGIELSGSAYPRESPEYFD